MKNLISFAVLFSLFQTTIAQSGYLGKKNFVEFKIRSVPSYKHINYIKGDDAIKRLRLLNSSYSLSISRVFARNFEVSAGYEFARINCMTDYYLFEGEDTVWNTGGGFYTNSYYQNFLQDPQMIYHGGTFSLSFYRLGSLAPIGKFIGFTVNYGLASYKNGTEVSVGQRGILEKDGFFKSVGPIGDIDTYALPQGSKYAALILKAKIGRNYPISDHFMINCGLSFPILSRFTYNGHTDFGWDLEKSYTLTESTTWRTFAFNSVRFYNRVSAELGIRYHF